MTNSEFKELLKILEQDAYQASEAHRTLDQYCQQRVKELAKKNLTYEQQDEAELHWLESFCKVEVWGC